MATASKPASLKQRLSMAAPAQISMNNGFPLEGDVVVVKPEPCSALPWAKEQGGLSIPIAVSAFKFSLV